MRLGFKLVIACILAVALFSGLGNVLAADNTAAMVPSIGAIAAALKHQAVGADLDVRYTQSENGVASFNYHYVRIPEAISLGVDMIVSRPGDADCKRNVPYRYSFDCASDETRSLSRPGPDGCSGTILRGLLGSPLATQMVLDGARGAVPSMSTGGLTLFECVEIGKVGSAMVEINGHPCWPVYFAGSSPDFTLVAYLDPKIGFNPRAYGESKNPSDKPKLTILFGDYREVARGIWFPYQRTAGVFKDQVTAIRTDRHPKKSEVIIKFPSKSKVRVGLLGTTTIVTK